MKPAKILSKYVGASHRLARTHTALDFIFCVRRVVTCERLCSLWLDFSLVLCATASVVL